MVGKPKYKYGDKVSFKLNDKKIVGIVYIIDSYGTFFDDSDVSYDILATEKNGIDQCLYKHIREDGVTKEEE